MAEPQMVIERARLEPSDWLKVGDNWIRVDHIVSVRWERVGAILPSGAVEGHWIFTLRTTAGVFKNDPVDATEAAWITNTLGLTQVRFAHAEETP
jgi:hypothetical protein